MRDPPYWPDHHTASPHHYTLNKNNPKGEKAETRNMTFDVLGSFLLLRKTSTIEIEPGMIFDLYSNLSDIRGALESIFKASGGWVGGVGVGVKNTTLDRRMLGAFLDTTNATRRNHFSKIFQFFICHKNHKILFKNCCFQYLFAWKVTLTLTPGMGVGVGEHLGPQNPKHLNRTVRTKTVHTSGHFSKTVRYLVLEYVHIYRKRHRIL